MKDKYLNAVILVVVASGTVMAAFVGNASQGGPLQTVFFAFVRRHHRHPAGASPDVDRHPAQGILTRSEKELEH